MNDNRKQIDEYMRSQLAVKSEKLIKRVIVEALDDPKKQKIITIKIPELAALLNVPENEVFREVDKITDDLFRHPIEIKGKVGGKEAWVKFPILTKCKIDFEVGIEISLNEIFISL